MKIESKHWVSRSWLIITNTLLLLISLGGIGVMSYFISKNGGLGTLGNEWSFSKMALYALVFSCALFFTSLSGCFGALRRNNCALTIFIIFLWISIASMLAIAVYLTVMVVGVRAKWSMITSNNLWETTSLEDKNLIQFTFQCCGLNPGDGTAFTGSNFSLPNPCTSLASNTTSSQSTELKTDGITKRSNQGLSYRFKGSAKYAIFMHTRDNTTSTGSPTNSTTSTEASASNTTTSIPADSPPGCIERIPNKTSLIMGGIWGGVAGYLIIIFMSLSAAMISRRHHMVIAAYANQ